MCVVPETRLNMAVPLDSMCPSFEGATHTMGSLGVRVAANRLDQAGFPRGQMHNGLQRASDQLKSGCLIGDSVRIVMDKGWDVDTCVFVTDLDISSLELSKSLGDLSSVKFESCIFRKLELEDGLDVRWLPQFSKCNVAEVEGCSEDCLPEGVFDQDCRSKSSHICWRPQMLFLLQICRS